MTTISRSERVPYTAQEMYDLVNDIERYPEFIPWCKRCRIMDTGEGTTRASMTFAKGGVEKTLETVNRHERGRLIDIRLADGPFRHLEGYWRFHDLGDDTSKVTLDMEFEFSNRLVAYAFGKVFTQIANTMVDAFARRAREVYGERQLR